MTTTAAQALPVKVERLFVILSLIAKEPRTRDELRLLVNRHFGEDWSLKVYDNICIPYLKQRGLVVMGADKRYRLGGFGLSELEQTVLFNGLSALGEQLRSPIAARVQSVLADHLGTTERSRYPVLSIGHRLVVREHGEREDRNQLMDQLIDAIRNGHRVRMHPRRPPKDHPAKVYEGFPLQLIFKDIAWYLLFEDRLVADERPFKLLRVDRLAYVMTLLRENERPLVHQRQALEHGLDRLRFGWDRGIAKLDSQDPAFGARRITVRFAPEGFRFVEEYKDRHPTLELARERKELSIALPEESIEQFRWWVMKWGERAEVISPPDVRRAVGRELAAAAAFYGACACGRKKRSRRLKGLRRGHERSSDGQKG